MVHKRRRKGWPFSIGNCCSLQKPMSHVVCRQEESEASLWKRKPANVKHTDISASLRIKYVYVIITGYSTHMNDCFVSLEQIVPSFETYIILFVCVYVCLCIRTCVSMCASMLHSPHVESRGQFLEVLFYCHMELGASFRSSGLVASAEPSGWT